MSTAGESAGEVIRVMALSDNQFACSLFRGEVGADVVRTLAADPDIVDVQRPEPYQIVITTNGCRCRSRAVELAIDKLTSTSTRLLH